MRTVQEAARALASGQTTSRALVEECLARIEDAAGEGARAFIAVYADQARQSADAMDALRRANRAPGPYAGIPISIKDLLDVAGETTRAGSAVLAGALPASDHAIVVKRLLSAGLIPVGRTNMTEFAFSGVGINPHYGTPQSPFGRVPGDPGAGRVSGGSSSGAAVSVSDGMALMGVGTDTGGSCRIPAAFCGIAGFKPTARRVPTGGVYPLSPSLDSVGPLANSAACCATMDAIMAGDALPLPELRPAGLRLLMPTNTVLDDMDAATERAIDRAVQRLDRAGVVIHHGPMHALDLLIDAHAHGGFAVAEAYAWHRDLLGTRAAQYDPRVSSRILPGARMPAADYIDLVAARQRVIGAFEAEMAPHDALIMPTVPIAPPHIAAFAAEADYKRLNALILRNPSLINFFDGCAISLPCHEGGYPPAGLTLAATAMADRRLLALATALEPVLARHK